MSDQQLGYSEMILTVLDGALDSARLLAYLVIIVCGVKYLLR
jgi:hypothetical protein